MDEKVAKITAIKNVEKIAENVKISIPSSKSYLNRALILASIQDKKIILKDVYDICDDVEDMINSLKNLGIKIDTIAKKNGFYNIVVCGKGGKFITTKNGILNCGLGGTTTRFLLALSSLFDFEITVTAEKKMLERPVGEIIEFLQKIGKKIKFLGEKNHVPVYLSGTAKNIKKIELDCSQSSQFLSAILLVANQLKIEEIHVKNLVSKSYINITLDVLKKFGIFFKKESKNGIIIYKNRTKIANNGSKINSKSLQIKIEEDCSSASYFLALKAIFGLKKNIIKVDKNLSQGDAKFVEIIKKIKNFNKTKTKNKMLILNMESMPDVSMTAMIVCALCDFKTKIKGLQTLEHKECERLSVMHRELQKVGIKTEISKKFDAITIFGNSKLELKKRVQIETYNDHRIAMCFAILGAKIGNIDIKNCDVVNKSFRNFWQELNKFNCVKIV